VHIDLVSIGWLDKHTMIKEISDLKVVAEDFMEEERERKTLKHQRAPIGLAWPNPERGWRGDAGANDHY